MEVTRSGGPTEFTRWKRVREGNDASCQEAFGPSGGAGEERTGQPGRYEPVQRGKRAGQPGLRNEQLGRLEPVRRGRPDQWLGIEPVSAGERTDKGNRPPALALTGDDIESSYRLTPAGRPVVDHEPKGVARGGALVSPSSAARGASLFRRALDSPPITVPRHERSAGPAR